MPNPDVVLIGHMLEAVDRIGTYVDGVGEGDFWGDREKQDAVLRQLQVLGERQTGQASPSATRSMGIPAHLPGTVAPVERGLR